MATEQVQGSADVREARERFVPRGIATTDFVVARAEGATLWDADGNEVLDFAGGIACQNLGHNPEAVVRAVHEQVDRYLHQCFMVGMYEPYVEVARRLDALWPGESETKTLLVNSGAEAVENAVKIARAATGRPGVVVFDRAFHGRTNLTMAMTSKLVYKQGFGPFAPEVYRAPAPYPYRGVSVEDALAGLELLFKQDVSPDAVACVVLETVQGEGGFIPMPAEFIRALKELCEQHGIVYVADEVQSGCGRTGAVWAIEHARRRARPDRRRQDARRRPAARGRDRQDGADGRAAPGRARRHLRRQPGLVRGGLRGARPARRAGVPRARRRDRLAPANAARRARREARGDRRGARPRLDAGARVRGALRRRLEGRHRPPPASRACCSSPAACTGT